MKYPYPIKDFTKPKQYPDPDKKSSSLLAWEFLRRNPKYQEDFDKFKKLKSPSAKRKLQEKWLPGIPLLTLFDPKDNQPRGVKLALTHAPRFQVIMGKGTGTTPIESLYKGDVFVTFNLNIPIKRQLDKTRKFLERERKEQKIKPIEKNYQRHIFPLYCRILDAKAENKTNELLAKFFYGDRTKGDSFEKIKQEIKVSYRLCDLDYIFIANTP
jgi:hypothetical protein